MSYSRPTKIEDAAGLIAGQKALEKSQSGKTTFKPKDENTLSDLAGDLNMEDAGAVTTEVNPSDGVEVSGVDLTTGASAMLGDQGFYKSGGPINDPNFYKGQGVVDNSDPGFYVNPKTEKTTTNPDDIEANLLANLQK